MKHGLTVVCKRGINTNENILSTSDFIKKRLSLVVMRINDSLLTPDGKLSLPNSPPPPSFS